MLTRGSAPKVAASAGLGFSRIRVSIPRGSTSRRAKALTRSPGMVPGASNAERLHATSPADAATFGADPLVSMNAWLLPPTIFAACRAIAPSPRGELELQDAVRYCIDVLGERFQVVQARGAVLDLSHQADIPLVAERLRALEARP